MRTARALPLILLLATFFSTPVRAQEIAEPPNSAASDISRRLDKLEANQSKLEENQRKLMASIGGGRVLALAEVKRGRLVFRTEGVSYTVSGRDGTLSFPNPKRLRFVALLSDASEARFITATHFVVATGDNNVKIRSKALDTKGEHRTFAPDSFTAVVIGFESP